MDNVYDVMWSPVHPAVFATVNGMGCMDIWNLNKDTEVNKIESNRNLYFYTHEKPISVKKLTKYFILC